MKIECSRHSDAEKARMNLVWGELDSFCAASKEGKDKQGDADTLVESWTDELLSIDEPRMYQVLLFNDDHTPMDFVVHLLINLFYKNIEVATEIMLKIHLEGKGVCGVFSREIAETKVRQVKAESKKRGFPLRCAYEPVP